jgi:hypothetical protein
MNNETWIIFLVVSAIAGVVLSTAVIAIHDTKTTPQLATISELPLKLAAIEAMISDPNFKMPEQDNFDLVLTKDSNDIKFVKEAYTDCNDSDIKLKLVPFEDIDFYSDANDIKFDEDAYGSICDANQVVDIAYDVAYIDITDFEPPPSLAIVCKNGNEVVIDYGGDEVKVTGACEEGAKVFFEEMLKPLVDDYLASIKANEYIDYAALESSKTLTIKNDVVIDFSGDEIKVTGASEEGAKVFFEELLKPIVDTYMESKREQMRAEIIAEILAEKGD